MCQLLKLPLLLIRFFSLPYMIGVTEETGTLSLNRLFREIIKKSCFKERAWETNSLGKSEIGKVIMLACPNSRRSTHCKHSLLSWKMHLNQLMQCESQSTHGSSFSAVSFWSLLVWWLMTKEEYDTIAPETTSSRTIIFRCWGKASRTLQATVFLFIISIPFFSQAFQFKNQVMLDATQSFPHRIIKILKVCRICV